MNERNLILFDFDFISAFFKGLMKQNITKIYIFFIKRSILNFVIQKIKKVHT